MAEEPKVYAEDSEEQVNVGRYLRFVISFLLIMFSVLGLYEYYYGAQARKAEELQRQFDAGTHTAAYSVATSSDEEANNK